MAFVFRAERFSAPTALSCTPERIGPGAYNLYQEQRASVSLAPFLSKTSRDDDGVKLSAAFTPGPGSYLPLSESREKKNCSLAFRSGVKRFPDSRVQTQSKLPGPTSYIGPRDWNAVSRSGLVRSQLSGAARRRNTAVKWERIGSAPSIPARTQSHGYIVNDRGDLQARKTTHVGHTGLSSDSAGPGAYNVEESKKHLSKSCVFGRSRSKQRDIHKTTLVPGPGHYNLTATTSAGDCHGSGWVSFASRVKRFAGSRKSLEPGPGHYDVSVSSSTLQHQPRAHQAFSRNTGRSELEKSLSELELTPGPGSFNLMKDTSFPSAMVVRLKAAAIGANANVPFCSSDKRFHNQINDSPGPGSFNLCSKFEGGNGLTTFSEAAFGSSRERFQSRNGKSQTPGPATYQIVERAHSQHRNYKAAPSSMFCSRTRRFRRDSRSSTTPGPSTYKIRLRWGNKPSKNRAHSAFMLGKNRFDTKSKANEVPGPGSYTLQKRSSQCRSESRVASVFASKSSRFVEPMSSTPGPGSFDISAPDSLIKRSFNITIGDEYVMY